MKSLRKLIFQTLIQQGSGQKPGTPVIVGIGIGIGIGIVVLLAGIFFGKTKPLPPKSPEVAFIHDGKMVQKINITTLHHKVVTHAIAVADLHQRYELIPYQAYPAAELLSHVFGPTFSTYAGLGLSCRDGFYSEVPRTLLEQHRAYFAFARRDQAEFSLHNYVIDPEHPRKLDLGPLYLIWQWGGDGKAPKDSDHLWAYQIHAIDLLSQVQAVQAIPVPESTAVGEVKHGYELFRQQCQHCHSGQQPAIDAALQAPSVALLKAAVETQGFTWFHQWVRDPRSLKPEAKMPSFSTMSSAELNDIIRYLRHRP